MNKNSEKMQKYKLTYAGIEPAIFRSVGGRLAIGPAGHFGMDGRVTGPRSRLSCGIIVPSCCPDVDVFVKLRRDHATDMRLIVMARKNVGFQWYVNAS